MIDPNNITNFNLSDTELEQHILFWVCAAGKNGITASKSLDKFLTTWRGHSYPFHTIFRMNSLYNNLPSALKDSGIGCYNHKARTFYELSKSQLDLRNCSTEELEKIYGIGMKTSRCFILHSRRNARCAGLDTHILKYLKKSGIENVPKSTPSSKKEYLRLENEFLKIVDRCETSVAEFDLKVWKLMRSKKK
jgi:hypothetical protein